MMHPSTLGSTSSSVPTRSSGQKQASSSNFLGYLQPYCRDRFTGCLAVNLSSGPAWQVYFHLGRVIWLDGGTHPLRQWQRYLRQHQIQLEPSFLQSRQGDRALSWEYHLLVLMVLHQSANLEQITALMADIARERLFELTQQMSLAALKQPQSPVVTLQAKPGLRPSSTGILPQAAMLPIAQLYREAQAAWQHWVAAGLTHCSANVAPRLIDSSLLQQQVAPGVYRKLVKLLNGQYTLCDIAALTEKTPLQIARLLLPYVNAQAVVFKGVADLKRLTSTAAKPAIPHASVPKPEASKSAAPLIACVEDDPTIQRQLAEIFHTAGYRFLAITDPVQALPILLKHKPDMVFLDVVMPVANGYEICAQIRRVGEFAQLPVVMLTGQDGMVDRVRAKVVGASGFLSKPIETQKLLQAVAQHTKSAVAA